MSCECDWCVPATAIAKRHVSSTRRVRDEVRQDAIAKSMGIDLAKARQAKREEAFGRMAHTNQSGYDEATLEMLARAGLPLTVNKSARGAGDPSWDRLLAVHAAAAAGDPAAMSAWAAFEGLDPGAARMVPEVVKMRQPRANKSDEDDEDGQTFDDFMASLGRGGSLGKSVGLPDPPASARAYAGSRPGPRNSLEQVDSDPDFQAWRASFDQTRRF